MFFRLSKSTKSLRREWGGAGSCSKIRTGSSEISPDFCPTSKKKYLRSLLSNKRIFSVNVLATSRSSNALRTGFSLLSSNCKLNEIIQFRNKSGICSSMSVSGGYSMLFKRNERKLSSSNSGKFL